MQSCPPFCSPHKLKRYSLLKTILARFTRQRFSLSCLFDKIEFLVEGLAYSKQLINIYWITECTLAEVLNNVASGCCFNPKFYSFSSPSSSIHQSSYSLELCHCLSGPEMFHLLLWRMYIKKCQWRWKKKIKKQHSRIRKLKKKKYLISYKIVL